MPATICRGMPFSGEHDDAPHSQQMPGEPGQTCVALQDVHRPRAATLALH